MRARRHWAWSPDRGAAAATTTGGTAISVHRAAKASPTIESLSVRSEPVIALSPVLTGAAVLRRSRACAAKAGRPCRVCPQFAGFRSSRRSIGRTKVNSSLHGRQHIACPARVQTRRSRAPRRGLRQRILVQHTLGYRDAATRSRPGRPPISAADGLPWPAGGSAFSSTAQPSTDAPAYRWTRPEVWPAARASISASVA